MTEDDWSDVFPQLTAEEIELESRRQLEIMREAFNDGAFLALYDALLLCSSAQLPPPTWIIEANAQLLSTFLPGSKNNKMGRQSGPFMEYYDDWKHYIRHNCVEEIREEWSDKIETGWRNQKDRPSLEEIFEMVSCELASTDAFGAPDTIKYSWKLVKKSLLSEGDGSKFSRFYMASQDAIDAVGGGVLRLKPYPYEKG